MESDDPPGQSTAQGDASASHRRLASASAESSSSQASRPVPSLAERLGLGAGTSPVAGPSSYSKAEDVAAAEPGTPRATPSRPIALATMSNAISNSPSKSALSPSRGSSSSEEEGMIKEEDAESEEEGEVDESDHREPPSQREREQRDREHARSSSNHQYRSDRSSPRAVSSSAAEQQQQQQHQPPPSSSSSSSSSVMPPARRWGQHAPTPRNDRSDAFVPPHHPPVHAHADRERDWERQREQQQRPGPSTMWPPSRYDDVRPPFAQGDRDRKPRSASSSAYRQRSAQDDRATSWSRNRRSASPIERDRRYERRGTERLPSPTVPLSGPNSIGARPPPPLPYPNASLRDEGLDRQGRPWGSGPASAGPSTRWNRWSGRERERGERERDRNDFDEARGPAGGDAWHPPPSRLNDDRGERGNFRRGSDWRTMDDNFVRSRTPSLQHHQQRAAAGDLAAADVWRRSPEFTRSETSQQPFARSRSSTSNLGATSSPPPPPIVRAPSPPAARGQQRATWTGGFEPPPRDAGWGGKARRNSQQSSGQPAGELTSSGEPEPTIKVEAQDDVEPSREEAPVVQESEAPPRRPLAAEDASAVKDYAVEEVKELAVTQDTNETSSPPTATQQESPPTSPPSLKKEIESAPPHPPKQMEPSAAGVVDEEQQPPPFSQSAAPTLPAEAQMQAPASASEAAALTVPAIPSAPEVTAAVKETPVETQGEQQAAEASITPPAAEPSAVEAEAQARAASADDVDMPDTEAAQPPQTQPSRESESSELKAVLDEAAAVAAASGEQKPDVVVEADATADVTMKTPDSGEGEQDRVGDDDQDRIDEEGASSPLPPQKTDEELEEAKRATILRLITTGKQPDSDEVIDKLIAANQRMAEQTTFSLMESAVHGPPPPALEVKIDVYEETPETQRMRSLLTERVKATNKRLAAKTERLRRQYKALNNDWQAHCARLDRAAEARDNARKAGGGSNTPQGAGAFAQSTAEDSGANSQTQPSMSQPLMTPSISGRSNRRGTQSGGFGFGDAVRSEAEFLEILASLETADMQDPEARAARTATTVPDQLINPDRDALLKYEVDERNHFVANPVSYYLDEFDPDFWSQEEKVIFARKYALWPKQFGKIATALPNKTASQCVYYYYLTKHQPGHDYKAITAARNRNQKRKSRVMKPKKGRGSALMADLKSAKGDDDGGADGGDAPMSPMDARASLMGGDAAGLMPLIEEEEGGAQAAAAGAFTPGGSTVKRLGDASSSTKPKSGRGGKRVKGQGKGKGGAAAAAMAAGDMSLDSPPIRSPSGAVTPAEEASADSDLAAAEALGALSGMMPMTAAAAKSSTGGGGGKKRKQLDGAPITPGEDGSPSGAPPQRKPRQATSSYWSVQERGEFLKGIAIHGKDWKLVAARLNAKSAAQARNYFARNAEVPDFVEAAALGEHHAEQPLSVREQLAVEWAKEKLGVGVPTPTGGITGEGSQQPGSGHSSARPGPSPMMSKESSPEPSGMPPPPRRYGGMGIMSLLNEERPSSSSQEQRPPPPPRAAPVMHEWYDSAQPPMSSQSTAPSSDREAESTDSEGFAFSSSRASPAMPHAYVPRPSYQQSHSHGSYEGRPYLPDARTRDEGPPPPLPPSSLPSLPRLSTPGGSAGGLGAPGSSLRSTYSGGGEYPASTSATVASFARPPVYNSSSVRESLPSPLSGGGSSHHHDPLGSGRTSMPPPPTSSLGSRPYGSLHAPSQPQQQQRHSSWSAGHSASSASPASPLPPISSYPTSSSYSDRLAPRQSQTSSSSQQHRTLAPPPPLASRSHFSPGGGGASGSTGSRSASPGGSALPPYRPSSGEAWPSMSSSSSSSASRGLAPPSSSYHQQQRSTSYGSASSSAAPYLPRPSTSPYPPTSTSTGSGSAPRVSPFAPPPPQSQKEHGGSPLLPHRLPHPQQQQQQHGSGGGGGGGGGQTRPGSGHGYEEGRG